MPQNNNQTNVQENIDVNQNQFIDNQDEDVNVDDSIYHIVLMNNDNTSAHAVVQVLEGVFQHDQETAFRIMQNAHENGEAICYIDTLEGCENKLREAIQYCAGNANETIEGCQGEDGNDRPHYFDELGFMIREHQDEAA